MAYDYDTAALRALVDEMVALPPDRRLEALKRAVIEHGGRWDLPSDKPGIYQPVLMSAQVFGVCAFAETIDELPVNWLRAAENALAASNAAALPDGPEKDMCLRKLLEAKDCAVRAALEVGK